MFVAFSCNALFWTSFLILSSEVFSFLWATFLAMRYPQVSPLTSACMRTSHLHHVGTYTQHLTPHSRHRLCQWPFSKRAGFWSRGCVVFLVVRGYVCSSFGYCLLQARANKVWSQRAGQEVCWRSELSWICWRRLKFKQHCRLKISNILRSLNKKRIAKWKYATLLRQFKNRILSTCSILPELDIWFQDYFGPSHCQHFIDSKLL